MADRNLVPMVALNKSSHDVSRANPTNEAVRNATALCQDYHDFCTSQFLGSSGQRKETCGIPVRASTKVNHNEFCGAGCLRRLGYARRVRVRNRDAGLIL